MNALKLAELLEKLSDAKAHLESAGRAHRRAESELRYASREKEMDAWKVYGPFRGDYFRAKRATADAYDQREATATYYNNCLRKIDALEKELASLDLSKGESSI
jgi:hypothetical protein